MNINKIANNKKNQQKKVDPNLSRDYQDAFKRGLNKKYLHHSQMPSENREKDELIDRLRKNLQAGLKEKYPEKSDNSRLNK